MYNDGFQNMKKKFGPLITGIHVDLANATMIKKPEFVANFEEQNFGMVFAKCLEFVEKS